MNCRDPTVFVYRFWSYAEQHCQFRYFVNYCDLFGISRICSPRDFSLNFLKAFMATIATQKKQSADLISRALLSELPPRASATLQLMQEKLAANELSDEAIRAIAAGSMSSVNFDKAGRWTTPDSVGAYRPNMAKRRKKEDPIFDLLQSALTQTYEAEGMTGVMSAMRYVVQQTEDELWSGAGDNRGWKHIEPLATVVAIADNRAKAEIKRARSGEEYVTGLEHLDALINGAKPAKKAAKDKTPAVAVPGKMTSDERVAFNAKVAAREKRAAAKAKK